MLEIILAISFIMGILIMILGIQDGNISFNLISLLLFIFTMAGSMYIEVPGVDDYFMELGLVGISLGCIFINILYVVAIMVESKSQKKYRI